MTARRPRLHRIEYHDTESGLRNVWLTSGYVVRKTPYGKGVSIQDVAGLHKAICNVIARKPSLTGAELRFLGKEMEMSQSALARLPGESEEHVKAQEKLRFVRGRIWKEAA